MHGQTRCSKFSPIQLASSVFVLLSLAVISKMSNLTQECLEHIFLFLTPKDWIPFSKVSASWNLAAKKKRCQKYIYDENINRYNTTNYERIEVIDFCKILLFVAPKLKEALIEKVVGRSSLDVVVGLGQFRYLMTCDNEDRILILFLFLGETTSVEKLVVNFFDDGRRYLWERFFEVNPLKSFKFYARSWYDHLDFYENCISMLPNDLEEIILLWCDWKEHGFRDEHFSLPYHNMLQLIQRQTNLSKVSIANAFTPAIATELARRNSTITELSLVHSRPEHNAVILEHLDVPSFTKVTDLQLFGFPINDNLCRQIAESCQSICTLRLTSYNLSKRGLRLLMSLPNLTELHINPTTKISLVQEVKKLKRLYYYISTKSQESHYQSFARALPLMPSLTSLTLVGSLNMRQPNASPLITESTLFQITRTAHSRGQNVVFYSLTSLTSEARKIFEIACEATDSNDNFSIYECLNSYP